MRMFNKLKRKKICFVVRKRKESTLPRGGRSINKNNKQFKSKIQYVKKRRNECLNINVYLYFDDIK